ncbi:MAG: hypothetical protein CFK52_13290 [Chloracidobacterium sp. CP2_5A]|nr:MAG: hypothetical protein CFK52_13290 [Chloracidobacterium sp. CP2_5A]
MLSLAFRRRWRWRRPVVWVARLLFLTSALWPLAGCQSPVKTSKTSETTAAEPVTVSVTPAQAQRRQQFIVAAGTIAALRRSAVAPGAPGRVTETPVAVGAFVEAGDVLLRLDDREACQRLEQARAALAQAEAAEAQLRARLIPGQEPFDPRKAPEAEAAQAELAAAEADAQLAAATFSRYERLARNNNVTRAQMDEARANVERAQASSRAARHRYDAIIRGLEAERAGLRAAISRVDEARAAVALAEKALDDTALRAPFAGQVAERFVNVGEYAAPDRPAMELVALEQLKLELQLPETDAARVRRGQEVEAATDAYPELVIRGRVTVIRPLVDAAARRLAVEVVAPNPERKLRPGMFVTARLLLGQTVLRVVAPKAAVRRHPALDAFTAFVVEGDRARLRVVQVGEAIGSDIEILSGVSEGEKVILSNLEKLNDGMPILYAR